VRDPNTCAWGPCGWPKCCEHGDHGCEFFVLEPDAMAEALAWDLNAKHDQARLDRDDYEEERTDG